MDTRKISRLSKGVAALLAFILLLPAVPAGLGPAAAKEVHDDRFARLYGTYDLYGQAPLSVIVELDTPSLVEAKHLNISQTEEYIDLKRRQVLRRIEKAIPKAEPGTAYDTLLAGLALTIPAADLPRLATIPGIRAIYPNLTYTVDMYPKAKPVYHPEEVRVKAPLLDGLFTVREEWRYTGDGVTIAVVDSGVDYRHPDLIHAFGEYKGWDFIDQDQEPLETPYNHPAGEATTHGTQMAGIMAARGTITGIAPDATLLAYRVIGPGGTGRTEHILAALEKALADGADVASLALNNGEADWALGKAVYWAERENLLVITSNRMALALDDGALREADQPPSATAGLAVASIPGPARHYTAELVMDDKMHLKNLRPQKGETAGIMERQSFELIYVGQEPLENIQRLNLEGKLALLSEGQTPLKDYLQALRQAGAEGAIILLAREGEPALSIDGLPLPTFVLPYREVMKLSRPNGWSGERSGQLQLIKISSSSATVPLQSPLGEAEPIQIQPDLLLPPRDVLSPYLTAPQAAGLPYSPYAYAITRGSQSAVALASGAVALLTQAAKENQTALTVEEKKEVLQATATSVDQLLFSDLENELILTPPRAGQLMIHQAVARLKEEATRPDQQEEKGEAVKENDSLQESADHQDASTPVRFQLIPSEGEDYLVRLQLAEKADQVQLWVFDEKGDYAGSVGTYVGVDSVAIPRWRGEADHQRLFPGTYRLVAYVTKGGKGRLIESDPLIIVGP